MSDNEDLLADDLGDHSLADYNLGNEEEEQLLADDYENASQNVPTSIASYAEPQITSYAEPVMVAAEYPVHEIPYNPQPVQYEMPPEPECVVPNIAVEVPNAPLPDHSTYAPYEPRPYEAEHAVPPAIPAAPMESPQIVPTDMPVSLPNEAVRERFRSERPAGARAPVARDIPDSLDKVVLPRGSYPPRGRTSWRHPQFRPRFHNNNQYRRNNMNRGNFQHRPQFPPPQIHQPLPQMMAEPPHIRDQPPHIRDQPPFIRDEPPHIHEQPPHIRDQPPHICDQPPHIRDQPPHIRHQPPHIRDQPPQFRDQTPQFRDQPPHIRDQPPHIRDQPPHIRDQPPHIRDQPPHILDQPPDIRESPPQIRPEPHIPQDLPERPIMNRPPEPFLDMRPPFPNQNRFFRPNLDEQRPPFGPMRPNFDRPMFYRQPFHPRPFPPLREVVPNSNHIPQVTIRHAPPGPGNMGPKQQEVRMLPVQLPPNLPGGLAGKKVLINPHFKGNFQPVDGLPLPAYIPTRIQKSPPLSPTLENKFGPIKDIDDAAERFIAEQRSALARAAVRKQLPPPPRREPQRYIENTTIEIANELAQSTVETRRHSDDDELLRRQEEFINANRAGLRRRMRSPTPPPVRRSPSPPRVRAANRPASDEDSEYRRRMREQESLRERVLRAKEARRRKNAVASQKQLLDRERERIEKEKERPQETKLPETRTEPATGADDTKPDTTRKSPEREQKKEIVREKSPVKEEDTVNSTCENLTPPRLEPPKKSPERALTPPLPASTVTKTGTKLDSDDDLDLILGDIDGILSDDEDTGRFKEKSTKSEPPKSKPHVDLRTKLPPKTADSKKEKPQRQKIIFHEEKKEERKKKEKTPPAPKRTVVTSSTKTDDTDVPDKKYTKTKDKSDVSTSKSRPRITFNNKKEPEKDKPPTKDEPKTAFSNRRVILQRKVTKEKSVFTRIEVKTDPAKPYPGIFSRAVRTAIGVDNNRIVIKKQHDPPVEYESDSDIDENKLLEEETGNMAVVENLPHGMTDTRLKTIAGGDAQSLVLDKQERSAKITFKTTIAAENFKRKFNNKMVAASRLSVSLL